MRDNETNGPDAYNIKVEKRSIHTPNGHEIPRRVGIYVEGTDTCLGINSENYGMVQYPDIKDAVDNALAIKCGADLDQIQFNSILLPSGTTGEMGGRVAMEWYLPMFNKTEYVTGDVLGMTFRMRSSHDGGWAIPSDTSLKRIACMNGWVMDRSVMSTKFKHTKNIDIQMIVSRIDKSLEAFEDGMKQYGDLFTDINETDVTWHEGLNIIKNLNFMKKDREEINHLWSRPYLWRGYDSGRQPEMQGWETNRNYGFSFVEIEGRQWKKPSPEGLKAKVGDLFNCITQHLTHTSDTGYLKTAQKGQEAFSTLQKFCETPRVSDASMKLYCEAPKITRGLGTPREVNKLIVTKSEEFSISSN